MALALLCTLSFLSGDVGGHLSARGHAVTDSSTVAATAPSLPGQRLPRGRQRCDQEAGMRCSLLKETLRGHIHVVLVIQSAMHVLIVSLLAKVRMFMQMCDT